MERRASSARGVAWAICFLYVSALVLYVFTRFAGLDCYERGSFSAMLSGRAWHPYVGRMLMPCLVNLATMLVPDSLQRLAMRLYLSEGPLPDGLVYYHEASFAKLVFLALALACFVGTGYLLSALARHYYAMGETAGRVAGLVGVALIPSFYRYTPYIYDPTTIFLSCLMLWALARNRESTFVGAFVLACVNKETAILFVPVFALFRWHQLARTHVLGWVVGLTALWAVIRVNIARAFSANGGAVVEFHLFDHNLRLLWDLLPALAIFMLFVAGIVFLAGRGWAKKPAELRLGLLTTLLPLVVASVLFGFLDEVRGWYDAYPFIFLLALPSAADILSAPLTPRDPTEQSLHGTMLQTRQDGETR